MSSAHITIKSVSKPVAVGDAGSIDVELDTVEHGVIPCTLTSQDATPYYLPGFGVITNAQLHADVASGLYGPVRAMGT